MDKRNLIIIILLIITCLVIYLIIYSGGGIDENSNSIDTNPDIINEDTPTFDLIDANDINVSNNIISGAYFGYSEEAVNASLENGDDVVLFFHASWCPTCRSLDRKIKSELESIPSGVSIFKVDYDNSSPLRSKYGVNYKHTLVQIDSDFEKVVKWSGSRNIEEIVDNIR